MSLGPYPTSRTGSAVHFTDNTDSKQESFWSRVCHCCHCCKVCYGDTEKSPYEPDRTEMVVTVTPFTASESIILALGESGLDLNAVTELPRIPAMASVLDADDAECGYVFYDPTALGHGSRDNGSRNNGNGIGIGIGIDAGPGPSHGITPRHASSIAADDTIDTTDVLETPHTPVTPRCDPGADDDSDDDQNSRVFSALMSDIHDILHDATSLVRDDFTKQAPGWENLCVGRLPDLPSDAECKRDFNDEFQGIFERADVRDSAKRAAAIRLVQSDFRKFSKRVAFRIVHELQLPEEKRTLKPVRKQRYTYGNVMFKFARNSKGRYGDDAFAAKAAASEVRNMGAILKAIHEGKVSDQISLSMNLTMVVLVGGYSIYATAVAPLRDDETLVYGSHNAGKSVKVPDLVVTYLKPLTEYFGLVAHGLRGHDANAVQLLTAVDVQVHARPDHKLLYLLHLVRFLPCTPSRPVCPKEFLFNMFRPEFMIEWAAIVATRQKVSINCKEYNANALSADVFSRFQLEEEALIHAQNAWVAYRYLIHVVVERVCNQLSVSEVEEATAATVAAVPISSTLIRQVFHENGLNMRYLWQVRMKLLQQQQSQLQQQSQQSPQHTKAITDALLYEMIARSVKQIARCGLRQCKSRAHEHAMLCAILQGVFGEDKFGLRVAVCRMAQFKFAGYSLDGSDQEELKLVHQTIGDAMESTNADQVLHLQHFVLSALLGTDSCPDFFCPPTTTHDVLHVHSKVKQLSMCPE
jgi:Clustered mitochondria/Translation initiation factor eIF3 subunit 135